jgi:hypothetical protein
VGNWVIVKLAKKDHIGFLEDFEHSPIRKGLAFDGVEKVSRLILGPQEGYTGQKVPHHTKVQGIAES